uniref:Putative Pre-SET protein n=1 Tax=Hordeum vulgare subsp. vulgare TaxID=112509 RepID=A0A023INA9_HORVV|nr:putative Pre-SET protein [Hordeum vulgare subsp. vulgare]
MPPPLARPACTGCRPLAPIAARLEKDRGEAQDIGRDAAAATRSPGLHQLEHPWLDSCSPSVLYYKQGYKIVRSYSETAYVIFCERIGNADPVELYQADLGPTNNVVDLHYYNLFDPYYEKLNATKNIRFVYEKRLPQVRALNGANGPLVFVDTSRILLQLMTIQHCRNREMPTLSVEPENNTMNNGMGSGVRNMQEVPCLDVDLASSPRGDVKMSLKFSVDPSKFHMPDLEAVFKMVEKKCLRSSDFSIHGILTEMCQCVVQLGTEHTVEHNTQSDIVGNGSLSENGINRKQKAREEPLVLKGLESGPANSTLAQQHHLALSISRIIHDVTDISKGEENLRISIIDESGREKCPPSFYYMPTNVVFQNALVSISLAKIGAEDCCSECFGNFLRAPAPCACARETGGDYAYTLDGLVKPAFIDECVSMNRFPEEHHRVLCKTCQLERSRNQASPEPCRGHLVRKVIKECWSKCGCNMQCGNQVVQRGIKCNLQHPDWYFYYLLGVFHQRREGLGAIQNMQNARYTRPILLDAGWRSGGAPKDEEALCLDGTFYGNVGLDGISSSS